jgi:hypothetical protein
LPVLRALLDRPKPIEPGSDVLRRIGPPPDLRPGAYPELREDEIALMFSGGVDSTATAVMLAERYRRIHLVTYRNGYGHWYHHRSAARVDELNRLHLVHGLQDGDAPAIDRVLPGARAGAHDRRQQLGHR